MTPQKLGKYKLIRKIASGGMAEIYLAKVSGLSGFEKLVVVKRILPQLAGDKQFIQMFLDEARIAATLQHPNIVQMYDIGAADGEYFISMEYIHGEDVRSIMRRLKAKKQWLPIDHSINIVIGVASGLHYAHEKKAFDGGSLNIVHRDVNPQNVLISYDGAIKLLDFGIAKASNRLNEETRHGTLKGKIRYMSPEQCRGGEFDRRSDVYALGIMLYELTTAARLYRGASDFDIMKQIIEQPVIPPSVRRPGYPPELERIVMKALRKKFEPDPDKAGGDDPECRYQTARELQADLESFVRHERLMVSDIALSSFMRELFEDHIEAWQAAGDEEQRAEQVARKAAGSRRMTDETIEIPDHEVIADSSANVSSYTPSGNGEVRDSARGRGRAGLLAAAGVLVLAVAAGGYWLATRGGGESSAASAPADRAPAAAPAAQGSARIESEPSGATVLVDGNEWHEPTPTTVRGLSAGSHRLTLKLTGRDERSVSFHVTANETAKVSLALRTSVAVADPVDKAADTSDESKADESKARGKRRKEHRNRRRDKHKQTKTPKPKAKAETGTLRIASSPSCAVIINGHSHGSTPIARIELPAGRHSVHLINPRFNIDRRYTVVIKPGQMTKRRYTFPIEQ